MDRSTVGDPSAGFHEGELHVQRQAGVVADASRLEAMLDSRDLSPGMATFLAQRTLVAITARDADGVLWVSPLVGPAGFLDVAGPQDLRIDAVPPVGDPLRGLPTGQEVGLIAVDFARRRRVRLNGLLTVADSGTLVVRVEQAFGNCPQYIQEREVAPAPAGGTTDPTRARTDPPADRLRPADITQIGESDTFFLGSSHPTRGSDASHRGGTPGFVRVDDDRTLWWPDYPGNNMFTSLGNLAIDPVAALLFLDFVAGRALHLTGRAELEQVPLGAPGDDGGTGRRVRFQLDRRTSTTSPAVQRGATGSYSKNPPLN
jgi:predicted pyridoxine 5'-phosphate oxidase superfamily flavin-nucleotide-binding protein